MRTFKVQNFVVLECDNTSHSLIRAADQSVGEKVVGRKGGLYLCEKFECVFTIKLFSLNKVWAVLIEHLNHAVLEILLSIILLNFI